MKLLRKAVTALGGIFLAALLIAALAPKATRGIAAALVQVTNTSANPVPMIDVDNPAYQPASLKLVVSGSSTSVTVPSTLPSGGAYRQMVINWVTGVCVAEGSGTLPSTLSLKTDGSQVSFFSATSTSSTVNTGYFGTKTSLYASPGSAIGLVVLNGSEGIDIGPFEETLATGGADALCFINADGYYVAE